MKKSGLSLLFICSLTCSIHAQPVTIKENDNTVTLSNNFLSVSFKKNNADLTSIITNKGVNLLGPQGRGYLLGPGFSMSPAQFSVVRQTADLVEIAFFHKASNHFQYDLHYIMRNTISGVYCFLYQSHHAADSAGTYGQTRWGIRADEQNYDYHLVRDTIQGPMPKMAELKGDNEIQDWTFKLPDGTVYTKYNYADYIEGRYVHGMAGQQSGLGLFVIQSSHEYLNGGPTKQYQNVHSNPYLICMFNCGHFLSDIRKSDDRITDEWAKLDGPFLLYANEGSSTDAIWKDAKQQASREIAQWPYAWMQHPDYPLQRGIVKGRFTFNKKPAAGTHIILAADGYDWQAQTRGYIYSTQTNAGGEFSLEHVRAGNYTLYVYGDNQTEEYQQKNIVVTATKTSNLGIIDKELAQGTVLWQIGIADRTTKGFKFSDRKRSYGIFDEVPDTLTYTIGKSREATDWYYAQTKRGEWNIVFNLDHAVQGNATLTLAIAGAAKNPLLNVLVNGQPSGAFKLGNDASVYRSAVLGGYYQKKEVRFAGALLKAGPNIITLALPDVKPGGGVMYDAIKLEAGEFIKVTAQPAVKLKYSVDKIIFSTDFNNGYDTSTWKAEIDQQPHSLVYVQNGRLVLDTKGGVTVWLNKLLTGNIMIEYKRKVLIDTGMNDRLSDLNNFWMASDPHGGNLFTRHGVLEEYDSLQLYYVGMGGNTNKTTRFRKYSSTGERKLLQEYTDSAHLLTANKEYTIRIVVLNGVTQYLVNDELYFSYKDPDPLTSGYFGFRSTKSRQGIDDIKVCAIK